MPTIRVNVPHQLETPTAIDRLRLISDQIKSQYGGQISKLNEEWAEDQVVFAMTAAGITVEGTVVVMESIIQVESRVPLAALPFRSLIEAQIRKSISEAVAIHD